MNDQELISKIHLLKEIKPSEDWVLSCRAKLAFRLEMDRKKNLLAKDAFALKELFAFLGKTESRPALVWAHSLIIALIVVLGGGALTTLAAVKSLPGSSLYPIKLAIEKARVSASFSEESKLHLRTQLADARLQELSDVANSHDSAEVKAEKISQVAEGIQDQLSAVNNQLPKSGTKIESGNALATAKMVNDKAGQASRALVAIQESMPNNIKPDLSEKLAGAAKAVEKTGIVALEAMIVNVDVLEQRGATTTTAEIAVKLSEEIEKAEKQISIKEQKIADKDGLADKLPINLPIRAAIINQFEQGLELLGKTKEALSTGDMRGAMEMLKAARAIIDGTDKMTHDSDASGIKGEIKGAASSTADDLAE